MGVAAGGHVLVVGLRVGRQGAYEHLEAGDEAVAVGHVLEEGAEAVHEGLLVLAVAQADAGSSISMAAVTVLRSAWRRTAISSGPKGAASQLMRPMPGGGPTSTSRPSAARMPASMVPERNVVPRRRVRL